MAPPRKRDGGTAQPGRKPPRKADEDNVIRKVRSKHGTRVLRRIICTACGKADSIDFAPRDPAAVLCKSCAFEKLGVRDPDLDEHRFREITCSVCGNKAKVPFVPDDPSDVKCKDCFLGIETRQGDRATSAKRVSSKVVRVNRRGE